MADLKNNETIRTVGAYVSRLRDTSAGERRLFRGQNTKKCLLPKIMRLAKEKGIPPAAINRIERRMLDRFRKDSVPLLPGQRDLADWELLSIAQHWGMPTRLLDWTANPLAGLWFAVSEDPREKGDQSVVWVVDAPNERTFTPEDNIFRLDRTCFFRPPHLEKRIVAQSGWFSVYRHNRTKYLPLEEQAKYKNKVKRLRIPGDCLDPLRRELMSLGYSHASMFPDLFGLARDIQTEFIEFWQTPSV
jgi:hypothetical protein